MIALKQMSVWDYVNEQVQHSTIKRVNWKTFLGMTLTEYITNLKTLYDLNADQTYNHIVGVLQRMNLDDHDTLRRVKISVYARFGEQNSYKKRQGGNYENTTNNER